MFLFRVSLLFGGSVTRSHLSVTEEPPSGKSVHPHEQPNVEILAT